MNDRAIKKLSEKFGHVSVAEDIRSIIRWAEVIEGSQQRLCDILVAYNDEIDTPLAAEARHQYYQESRIANAPQEGGSSRASAS